MDFKIKECGLPEHRQASAKRWPAHFTGLAPSSFFRAT